MKQIQVLGAMVAIATTLASATLLMAADNGYDSTQIFGGKLPDGYRDWKLISVAHEEGKLNDIRAILGNDIAVKAYREGKLPLPDGAIIARLAWAYGPSDVNNKAFGRTQSFVPGAPTNVQFMVKNSRAYASTGGWGFVQFENGKPDHIDVQACFACHTPVKDRDYVFTHYSP
ncbi:cytochrome P460 family protein [Dyella caseinilytica]|uniref:Cytochrome P460 family protein n=1 Tax=Dyella caseinilytica TaxID=1849581 RepID=A0ABX7GYB6_9GAMM|nr:cytochrome P460 family protein [Dyella caseinilytica]QRN55320.1 cytochrome P460 family protein [Dyella caseinilytica]GGA00935.1 cytochrome c oxidase subunit III [Dyella caseinilytica]